MGATTVSVAAPDYRTLPIEQREAVPSNLDYPQAVQPQVVQPAPAAGMSQGGPQTTMQPPVSQPVQPAVPSNVQWELYNQLQQMQQELAELRGLVEQQSYELNQLKEQQRQRYLDLDHRLNQLKSSPVATGSTPAPIAVSESVTPAKPTFDDKAVYDEAIGLMRERNFPQAIRLLEDLVATAPQSSYVPNAQYWLGELNMAVTPPDYETAKRYFVSLLRDYSDHQKVPDALYKLGQLYNAQGETAKAKVTLEKVVADYPSRQAAKLAKQLLSRL